MKTYDITTDSGDALDRKIERLDITLESSTIEERHNERSKATINV
jgi:hypothetical protein